MAVTESAQQARVLIVDDEPDIVENIAEFLTRKGFSVDTAMDGAAALNRLGEDETLMIVVADIRMPRLDGLTLLKAIKDSDRTGIKVILISGHAGDAEAEKALNLGAFHFFPKPLKLADLVAVIGDAKAALD